jgi:polyisoprenoid-binding protein YceI
MNATDQATIQKHMEELTLETNKYPEISFESSRVEPSGADQWKVQGNLSLHGVTRPVSVEVKRSGGAYIGHAMLKQTDFEIKPISIGGGMIKIKNEIEIDFEIYPR